MPRCKCVVEVWHSHGTPGLLCLQNRACAGGPEAAVRRLKKGFATCGDQFCHHHFPTPSVERVPASLTCLPLPINRLPHRHCHNSITASQSRVVLNLIFLVERLSRPVNHHAPPEEHRFKSPRGWRRAWTGAHKGQQGEGWPRC